MRHIYIHLLLLFSGLPLLAQEMACGTVIHPEEALGQYQLNQRWEARTQNQPTARRTRFVPVQLHIIRRSNGTGGIEERDLLAAFQRANDFYIGAQIHFYQCGPIRLINDDVHYEHDIDERFDLDTKYGVPNVMNIYITDVVTSGDNNLCGYAQFPGALDLIVVQTGCTKNGTTFMHEIGHYLGLYHTHETFFGVETVNGANCQNAGDLLCDTPADPRLGSGNINPSGCIYIGKDTDSNGDSYTPMGGNIMAYTPRECRYNFTPQQLERMTWVLDNERTYLNCATPPLNAEFYSHSEDQCGGERLYQFQSSSEGEPEIHYWDFGDKKGISIQSSPSYTYTRPGVYEVQHFVATQDTALITTQHVRSGAVRLPYFNGFDSEASLRAFDRTKSLKNRVYPDASAANDGNAGLVFDGSTPLAQSPFFLTPTDETAFETGWNLHYKAGLQFCVDARDYNTLQMSFTIKQLHAFNDNYSNFRVQVNGNTVFQSTPEGVDDSDFRRVDLDLSPYVGEIVRISLQGSHKYNKDRSGFNGGTATMIDNLQLDGVKAEPIDADEPAFSLNSYLKQMFQVYPNPASEQIQIEGFLHEESLLMLYNQLGQRLDVPVELELGRARLKTNELSNGLYIVKIHTMGIELSRKVIISHQ